LGGLPPLTARNGSELYFSERGKSEREALPTPYSRSDGVRRGGNAAGRTPLSGGSAAASQSTTA